MPKSDEIRIRPLSWDTGTLLVGDLVAGDFVMTELEEAHAEESVAAYCDHSWPCVLVQRSPPFRWAGGPVWRPMGFVWIEPEAGPAYGDYIIRATT